MNAYKILGAAGLVISIAWVADATECDLVGAHPEGVFCHDFEAADADGSDTYWSDYWNDTYGAPDRTFLIDETMAGVEGTQCMRLQVVNDTSEELTSGVSSGPKKFLGDVVSWDDLFFRRYVRFNADFHQGNFMHLGGMGACHPDDYPWACMGHSGERPAGDDRFSSNLEPWSSYQSLPWPGRWGFYSYYYEMYMDCGHPGPDDCYGDMFSPETDAFMTRGDWHVLEMTIHPGTPNQADGSQAFWIDGEKIFTVDGMAWRTTDELRINKVGVYLYIHNNPANTTNILDIDNVIISLDYIGPAPCEDSVELEVPCICEGVPDPEDASNVVNSGYCCDHSWQSEPCGTVDADADSDSDSDSDSESDSDPDAGSGELSAGDNSCGCRAPGSMSFRSFLKELLLVL
jgi:hypothetical protein